MDTTFVRNVPDLSRWGRHTRSTPNEPRCHTVDLLDVTVANTSPSYAGIVNDLAKLIASSRLNPNELNRWEAAVSGSSNLNAAEKQIIVRALARGIVCSGSDPVAGTPTCNERNFKGHVVEVLLYCMRIYLLRSGAAKPILFQPRKPKAMSASPGIDLLEIGSRVGGFYFHVWECKGTTITVNSAFNEAAGQLCDADGTAYQSFMEAHRALQDSPEIDRHPGLAAFVRKMPRLFYRTPATAEKRLGGTVACEGHGNLAHTTYFATAIGMSAHSGHENCHAVVVRFANFPRFLEELYEKLWNIY